MTTEIKSQYDTYIGKKYKYGGDKLEIGDTVIVHPTPTSNSKKPFNTQITAQELNFCAPFQTVILSGYAVINDYLFDRLELKRRA